MKPGYCDKQVAAETQAHVFYHNALIFACDPWF